jgi:hypothetical protein
MHLHGPERLKVVGVVMVEREKESYSGYMNWEVYVAERDGGLSIKRGLRKLRCDEEGP